MTRRRSILILMLVALLAWASSRDACSSSGGWPPSCPEPEQLEPGAILFDTAPVSESENDPGKASIR